MKNQSKQEVIAKIIKARKNKNVSCCMQCING